jgi:hypothetical protein
VRVVYQIRVEGTKRPYGVGQLLSKRVFVSPDRAKAYAPGFEDRCRGDGPNDIETVTSTQFVELELDEEES